MPPRPTASMDDEDEMNIEISERPTHWRCEEGFYDDARGLRATYDERMADPLRVNAERFVWDYWHVPNQYTLLRTPAEDYFGTEAYERLERALLDFGKRELGCGGITPIWMSCYVDSMRQELHADVPHGPFAFVLSLTPQDGDGGFGFKGGETQIMRPERLNYWKTFDASEVIERSQIMETISPDFNRLVVFDPRLPHGVTEVRGTQDPRYGRLVLHGWFTDPMPSFSGALTEEDATEALEETLPALYERLVELPRASGIVCASLNVAPDGTVSNLRFASDTLTPIPLPDAPSETDIRDAIMLEIGGALMDTRFPARDCESVITLPFSFE